MHCEYWQTVVMPMCGMGNVEQECPKLLQPLFVIFSRFFSAIVFYSSRCIDSDKKKSRDIKKYDVVEKPHNGNVCARFI